jgi:LysM repeat protein/uncharacterized protein YvpB
MALSIPPRETGVRRWLRVLICASAVAIILASALRATPPAQAAGVIHVVQPGENLFRIGLAYGVDWRMIMTANGLYTTTIYVGQALVIPDRAGAVSTAPPAAPATAPAPSAAPPAAQVYSVQPGDTLWQIAQRYGLTVADLMQHNGLANPHLIYAGQLLNLGRAAEAPGKLLAVTGRNQSLPLDCESRSAVDWAGYFGIAIDELAFFGRLPVSDDPDAGFVGSAYSAWGQVPPAPYGVHAGPVAEALQGYGLPARAVTGLTWEALRGEIDAGRPVIAWVIGAVVEGAAVPYTAASTGRTILVAPYEHTVIVVGYSAATVTVLDGGTQYSRSLAQFLASWGVLGNMAVVRPPEASP